MVFILPERPTKPNPINQVVEALGTGAEAYAKIKKEKEGKEERKKLEEALSGASTPQERQKAIESIMLSDKFQAPEKGHFERMIHQERAQAQQAELIQQLFGSPQMGMERKAEGGAPWEQNTQAGSPWEQNTQAGSPWEQNASSTQEPNAGAGFRASDLNDQQIAALGLLNPQLAGTLQHMRESDRRSKVEDYKIIEPMEKEIFGREKTARNSLERFNQLKDLNARGNIDMPMWTQISEHFNAPWLLSSDTALFNSIMLEEMGGLKEMFGARPSIFDVQMFLQGMPTTKMTQATREKLIKRKIQLNKAALIEAEAYRLAKAENGDPTTLRERATTKANQMVDDYMNGLLKEWSKEDAAETGEVIMEHPKYGLLKVKPDEVKRAEASGARLVN